MPYPAELLNTPSKKQLKPIGESEMGEDELRKKLRVAFDKFDADGSGAVSMQEMGKLVKALKMEVTPAQLKELMKEADPDGSGDINFDEFVAALQRQMKGGGGGLANVFNAAGDAFGWLNPLSWFGAPEPTPAPAPAPSSPAARRAGAGVAKGASSVPTPGPRPPIKAAPSEVPPMSPTRPPISPAMRKGLPPPQNAQFGGGSPKSAPSTPTSPATATGAEHFFIRGKNESPRFVPFPGSARSMGSAVSFNSSLSGRPRTMKVSQLFVARSNHAAAEEVRQQATAYSDFDEGRRAYFMGKQQRRIRAFQKQRKDAKRSVEKMKSLKNASMQEMRQGADDRHVKEVKMKARHAASGRNNVLDEKEVQLQSVIDRHEKALKAAEEHRVAHAQHRVQIREQVKELADEKESNAKEAALRVRHETRKEVRQEGTPAYSPPTRRPLGSAPAP
jgi:hypothetical protein